jgi:hypothetical protein
MNAKTYQSKSRNKNRKPDGKKANFKVDDAEAKKVLPLKL